MERTLWAAMRARHALGARGRPDAELAQTFFNSRHAPRVQHRRASTPRSSTSTPSPGPREHRTGRRCSTASGWRRSTRAVIRRILERFAWSVPYASLRRDAAIVGAASSPRRWTALPAASGPVEIDVVRSVFYRNKGAYVVGRVRRGGVVLPLVIPLLRAERGIVVDAVLLTPNEASIVFGFSWSYFRVDVPRPRELVEFLSSIMPFKRIDELYNAIGYNKHGKTELFRNLMTYLEQPEARFAFAEGDEGMVMAVFTLPAFNLVFKIIKDSFGAPKNTTRQAVMDKYHFVFVRDRVGRLADAQEFEHLEFPAALLPGRPADVPAARWPRETVRVGGRPGHRAARLHRAAGDAAQHLPPRRRARPPRARR